MNRSLTSTASIVLLTLASAATAGGEPITFNFDHDDLSVWSFSHGPEFPGAAGRLRHTITQGHDAPGCLAMNFSFEGGGNYVQAMCDLPDSNDARRASLWLHKTAGHRITFRAVDATEQTFQKSTEYSYDGWQQVDVDLSHWPHSFGGAADGKVQWPLKRFGILIENTTEPRSGTLFIDDVRFSPDAPERDTLSTYVATDFASPGGYWVGGGDGNRLEPNAWHFRFDDTSNVARSVSTDFSLLGRPVRLRLVIEHDGPGHELFVEMASHFQGFMRSLGRLAEPGRQVLDVPMGSMTTWQHFGGQADGNVRLPLRFRGLRLQRAPSGANEGTIRLIRMEIDTELPAGRNALLSPDVRHDDKRATFIVRTQNLQPQPVRGELVIDIRNLHQRLDRRRIPLTLPAAGETPAEHSVTCPIGNHHFLEAVFQWTEPGHIEPPASIGLSTVPAQAPPAPGADNPFGMGLYLYRWHADHRRSEQMKRLADLARRAGVAWIREEISWGMIEPREGEFHWDFYDELIDTARAHDLRLCGLLCYWSPFARANSPEGIEQYGRWVRAVVRRYKSKITHWEIWNEPNIFFWSGPKERYADLLTHAYDVIKDEDPDAVVLGCATSSIDLDFIKLTMDRGGTFDALSIHPYRGALEDRAYMDDLRKARAFAGDKPLWLTEIGFPSQQLTGYSERRQASLLARTYLASIGSGAADNICWYDFRNDGSDPYYNEMNFGLVRSDLRPKPAYRAMATIARTLADARLVGPVDVSDGAYAFRFTDDKRDTIAVCAPDQGRVLTFKADSPVDILNAMGEPMAPIENGDTRSLTLDTGMPVYITGPASLTWQPQQPALRLIAERTTVRPASSVMLTITPVPSSPVAWDLPDGWSQPTAEPGGRFLLAIPEGAPTGHTDLQAIVLQGDNRLRLPMVLLVQSARISL